MNEIKLLNINQQLDAYAPALGTLTSCNGKRLHKDQSNVVFWVPVDLTQTRTWLGHS